MIAATFDGEQFHLYSDGAQVASGNLVLGSVSGVLAWLPLRPAAPGWGHFGGKIAGFTLLRESMAGDAIAQIYSKGSDASAIEYEEGSKSWPVQTRGQAGYRAPQDASQMPRSKAPFRRQ